MIVEELVGRIGLDFTGAEKAASAVKSISSISGALGAVGGIMLATKAAFETLAVSVADEVGDLKDFGDAVGISVQSIQALGAAAIPTGASMEDVTTGLRKLADSAANAAKGNDAMEESFAALGVRVTDARGRVRPLEGLLNDVSNGLAKIHDPAKQVSLAIDVLGRGGVKLLPALRNGSDALKSVRKEAERLGVVMSEDTVQGFARVDDAFDGLKLRATGFRNIVAKAFLPSVENSLKAMTKFYDSNADKIEAISKRVASVITEPFKLVAEVAPIAVEGITKFVGELPGWAQGVLGLASALGVLALAFAIPGVPIIILAGLIALIMEDLQKFRDGAPSLLGAVIKEFENFKFQLEDIVENSDGFTKWLAYTARAVTALVQALSGLATFNSELTKGAIGDLGDLLTGDLQGVKDRRARKERSTAFTALADSGVPDFALGNSPFASDFVAGANRLGVVNPTPPRGPFAGAAPVINQGSVSVQVTATPGMDEQALAEKVAAEVKNQMDFTAEEVASAFGRE